MKTLTIEPDTHRQNMREAIQYHRAISARWEGRGDRHQATAHQRMAQAFEKLFTNLYGQKEAA